MVADWNAGAVFRYGPAGAYVETFTDELRQPGGWAVAPVDGLLYRADWKANVIRRCGADRGETLGPFDQVGGLLAPNGLVFVPRS